MGVGQTVFSLKDNHFLLCRTNISQCVGQTIFSLTLCRSNIPQTNIFQFVGQKFTLCVQQTFHVGQILLSIYNKHFLLCRKIFPSMKVKYLPVCRMSIPQRKGKTFLMCKTTYLSVKDKHFPVCREFMF